MTLREQMVIRLLLLVARLIAAGMEHLEGRPDIAEEIRNVSTAIQVHRSEFKDAREAA
jgi:hypothetical protein